MEHDISEEHGVRVLHLRGPVDVAAAMGLRDLLGAQVSAPSARVLVDLTAVPLIDSSGIGILVTAHRRAVAQGAGFALAGPTPSVARVFAMTRTNKLLQIHETVADGVSALREG